MPFSLSLSLSGVGVDAILSSLAQGPLAPVFSSLIRAPCNEDDLACEEDEDDVIEGGFQDLALSLKRSESLAKASALKFAGGVATPVRRRPPRSSDMSPEAKDCPEDEDANEDDDDSDDYEEEFEAEPPLESPQAFKPR